jgi:hypothetical protein
MVPIRFFFLWLVLAVAFLPAQADDDLFFGNSFTYAAMVKSLEKAGGVPKLVEAIAISKGKQMSADSVTAGGKTWDYLMALPMAKTDLQKTWDWVILQDHSNRATEFGDPVAFMRDGEAFSDMIAQKSPKAGIILYETWARPAGSFYATSKGAKTPEAMMAEIHENYGKLRDDLAAKNPGREVRVALVGTAWLRAMTENPGMDLYASDKHHGSALGYYLAAMVIYETLYHDSVKGIPATFFDGTFVIPPDDAAKLQAIADAVAGAGGTTTAAK